MYYVPPECFTSLKLYPAVGLNFKIFLLTLNNALEKKTKMKKKIIIQQQRWRKVFFCLVEVSLSGEEGYFQFRYSGRHSSVEEIKVQHLSVAISYPLDDEVQSSFFLVLAKNYSLFQS